MKKWLVVFVAVAIMLSSFSVAFAADISDFNFKPASEFSFLSDVLPQFNHGNGVYEIPVEIDSLSLGQRNIYNNVLSYYKEAANTGYFYFNNNGLATFLCLLVFPKSNFIYRRYLPSSSHPSSCFHCGFWYKNYSNNVLGALNLKYNPDEKNFTYYGGGFGNNTLPLIAPCSGLSLQTAYFPDESLYTSILTSSYYVPSDYNNFYFISDISSLEFVNANEYVPPVSSYSLIINYQYSNGTSAADSVTQTLVPGAEYSIPSPEVEGYTPDIPLVTGIMPEEDLTITVTYSKAFYPLTVQYQYEDGSKAAESVSFQYPAGFTYDIPSPDIEGYRPDKPTVSGEMPGNALEELVTYSGIPYTLTVRYRFPDGSQAAPDHSDQLFIGDHYAVTSPTIEGYHPNQTAVTGVMPASDVVSTVTYREDSGGSGGPGPSGPGEGGDSGGGGTGDGGGGSGDDPFIPALPPYSGNDPFLIPGLPSYSGYDPFIIRPLPPFSGYDPFAIPGKGGS